MPPHQHADDCTTCPSLQANQHFNHLLKAYADANPNVNYLVRDPSTTAWLLQSPRDGLCSRELVSTSPDPGPYCRVCDWRADRCPRSLSVSPCPPIWATQQVCNDAKPSSIKQGTGRYADPACGLVVGCSPNWPFHVCDPVPETHPGPNLQTHRETVC